jgi:hypothetical protein
VSYRKDSVFIRSVEQGKVVRDSLRSDKARPLQLTVHFPAHDNWNFRVNLKPTIQNEPSEFPQPEKLFVLSDIEGEFEGFRKILIGNGVIDETYNWIYGKGHVVICGDLFDRGLSVPETIWLMYKLEQPAKDAGGYFHVILGNHDIMNLSGDLRYVQPKYFQSAGLLGVNYMQLYSPDTELGRGCVLKTASNVLVMLFIYMQVSLRRSIVLNCQLLKLINAAGPIMTRPLI